MSKNFTANQFESTFFPRSLQNWEVPKFSCKRPHHRSERTHIIANSRGHLLPGVSRNDHSPWSDFKGTWSLPLRISRQVAEQLNGITDAKKRLSKCGTHIICPPHLIIHSQKEIKKDQETDKKKVEEPKEEVQKVETPSEEVKDVPETVVTEEKETESKILCPIHDLYKED